MKKLFASFILLGLLGVPGLLAQPKKPTSVVHIINVKFKADAAKADVDRAIAATSEINFPGLKNVWVKAIKNQLAPNFTHIIVMEFESQDALTKYAGSDAQKKWYESYMKVRDESRTNDVTN